MTETTPKRMSLRSSFAYGYGITKVQRLSNGNFGAVYRLTYENGRKIAAKVLRKNDEESRKLFIAEIRLLKKCSHNGIIKFLNFKISNAEVSKLFFTLELANIDLKRRYEKHKADERSARHIFEQIAAALSYLHNKMKVIHHDVKPDNILLMSMEDLPVAKLTDFGLSRTIAVTKKDPRRFGTKGYLAPELLKLSSNNYTKGSCNEKVDVFALGIALLEVSTTFVSALLVADEDVMLKAMERGKFASALLSKLRKSKSREFVAFFSSCVVVDVGERASAEQLLGHPWLTMEPVVSAITLRKRKKQQPLAENKESHFNIVEKKRRWKRVEQEDSLAQ